MAVIQNPQNQVSTNMYLIVKSQKFVSTKFKDFTVFKTRRIF